MKLPTTLAAFLVLAPAVTARSGPLVVIDPGHGGSNTGARGPDAAEKHVTLALAHKVTARLHHRRIATKLTRTEDRTLTLRQRVAIANDASADLFISIHANASHNRTQRGFETFVLTPRGVDIDARALRSTVGTPRPALDAETAAILDDVERGAAQWEAADLAARMQKSLRIIRGKQHDRGVRQDAHHVLLGATMPAVLVEVGFIDHAVEGKQLADPAVQDQIASALADAIEEQLAMTD